MGFQITTREFDRVMVVDAVGKLTLRDSRTQLRDLIHVLSNTGHKKFLLNLAGVDYMDSDGMGELVRCYSVVRQKGGETNPKYRPPVVATVAGDPMSSSSATTSEGSDGNCGSGPPSASNRATFAGNGTTCQLAIPVTYRAARSAVSASSFFMDASGSDSRASRPIHPAERRLNFRRPEFGARG